MKDRTPVIIVGMGDMGSRILNAVEASDDFFIAELDRGGLATKIAFTGNEIKGRPIDREFIKQFLAEKGVYLLTPRNHGEALAKLNNKYGGSLIGINFSDANGFDVNFQLLRADIPLISGGTGATIEQEKRLIETVRQSRANVIRAQNMSPMVVSLQAAVEEYARLYPNSLTGCELGIVESHQASKPDPSGTAKSLVRNGFMPLGFNIDYSTLEKFKLNSPRDEVIQIGQNSTFTMIRNLETQLKAGVPEQHLKGHGWHSYIFRAEAEEDAEMIDQFRQFLTQRLLCKNPAFSGYNPKKGVYLTGKQEIVEGCQQGSIEGLASESGDSFIAINGSAGELILAHNICGRQPYVEAMMSFAADFLRRNPKANRIIGNGKIYTMIDLLSLT